MNLRYTSDPHPHLVVEDLMPAEVYSATRFPDAQPLPGRPELDRLIDRAGVELVWDAERACTR